MRSLIDDHRFTDELRPLWEQRSFVFQQVLAYRWLDRARELLGTICRRVRLDIEGQRLETWAPIDSPERAAQLSMMLYELACGIDEERAVPKSLDVAFLLLAARTAAEAMLVALPESERLDLLCLRVRQLARAARRLEQESQRMLIYLADA